MQHSTPIANRKLKIANQNRQPAIPFIRLQETAAKPSKTRSFHSAPSPICDYGSSPLRELPRRLPKKTAPAAPPENQTSYCESVSAESAGCAPQSHGSTEPTPLPSTAPKPTSRPASPSAQNHSYPNSPPNPHPCRVQSSAFKSPFSNTQHEIRDTHPARQSAFSNQKSAIAFALRTYLTCNTSQSLIPS